MKAIQAKKAIWWGCGLFVALVVYYFANLWWGFTVPCLFHLVTGCYCPGCGITRMLSALIEGKIYAAFRFNPLLFALLPIFVFLGVDYIIAQYRGRVPLQRKVPAWIWTALLVIVLVYGVVRNLPWFSFLAPTEL